MEEAKFCIDCKYYIELNNLCARPRNDDKSYTDLVTGKVHNTTRYIKSYDERYDNRSPYFKSYDERYETKYNNCGKSGVFFVKSVQSTSVLCKIKRYLIKLVK
jgi:hypothetical protein